MARTWLEKRTDELARPFKPFRARFEGGTAPFKAFWARFEERHQIGAGVAQVLPGAGLLAFSWWWSGQPSGQSSGWNQPSDVPAMVGLALLLGGFAGLRRTWKNTDDTAGNVEPAERIEIRRPNSRRDQTPANWYPDPTRRYQYRYWDGDAWTGRVATGGVETTSPVPHHPRHMRGK
jgi:hypothetical protein